MITTSAGKSNSRRRNISRICLLTLFRTTAQPTFFETTTPRRAAPSSRSLRDAITTNEAPTNLAPVSKTVLNSFFRRSRLDFGNRLLSTIHLLFIDGRSQTTSSFCSSGLNHVPTSGSRHAASKPMCAKPFSITWLKCSFHLATLRMRAGGALLPDKPGYPSKFRHSQQVPPINGIELFEKFSLELQALCFY